MFNPNLKPETVFKRYPVYISLRPTVQKTSLKPQNKIFKTHST